MVALDITNVRMNATKEEERSSQMMDLRVTIQDYESISIVPCYVKQCTRCEAFNLRKLLTVEEDPRQQTLLQRTQQELIYNHDHIERYQWN